jgi:hypothetical protein
MVEAVARRISNNQEIDPLQNYEINQDLPSR